MIVVEVAMGDSGSKGGGEERDYFICPQCGEEVEAGARVCPNCGSDDRTGWSEDADKWGADIPVGYGPDEEFDYDEFVSREFAQPAGKASALPRAFVIALALAAAILVAALALVLGQ